MTILGLADFGSQTTEAFRALRKASKIPKGSEPRVSARFKLAPKSYVGV